MARSKSSDSPEKPKKPSRTGQIRQAYSMTRKSDPRIGLVIFGAFIGVFAVVLAIVFLVHQPVFLGIFGFVAATYPYYRFMNATMALFALGGLGAYVAIRWLWNDIELSVMDALVDERASLSADRSARTPVARARCRPRRAG